MKHGRPTDAIVIGLVVCLLATVAWAQDFTEVAEEARRIHRDGNPDEAGQLLIGALDDCRGDDEDRCKAYLYYSLGYLEQRQSVEDEAAAFTHLERAAGYYTEVLHHEPAHGPTLNNLALAYAGMEENDLAAESLNQAIAADPSRAYRYAMQLGDLQSGLGNGDAALAAYRIARDRRPNATPPLRRMVERYAALPVDRLPELAELAVGWSAGFPEVAREAYETAMAVAYADGSDGGDLYLLDWLTLMAERGWLSAESAAALPWDVDSVVGLRAFLEQPRKPGGWSRWWEAALSRRQALALAAEALGRDHERRGAPDLAAAYWNAGIHKKLAPPIRAYLDGELLNEPLARVRLLAALASLEFRNPEATEIGFDKIEDELFSGKSEAYRARDRSSSKTSRAERGFDEIEDTLFSGKSQAYGVGDLDSIQTFHMVLGRIYAERGTWTSGRPFRQGIFQLSSAVRTAEQRWRNTGFVQPLPEIKRLLAGGFLVTNKVKEARGTLLDTAAAYLDTDQLTKCAKLLEEIGAPASEWSAEHRQRLELLQLVLSLRQLAPEHAAAAIDRDDTSFLYAEKPERPVECPCWPAITTASTFRRDPRGRRCDECIDPEFLTRQRFKIFADGASTETPGHAVAALKTVLDQSITLIGTADLVRLERVQQLTASSLGPSVSRPELLPASMGETGGGLELMIQLTGSTHPDYVRIGPEAAILADVWQVVRPDGAWSPPAIGIRVEPDGVVTILPGADSSGVESLRGRLAEIPGVERIEVASGARPG